MARIASRGSQGIILKAQNVTAIRAEIARLLVLKIPVVTAFTDCPGSGRLAYVGLNNENAGRIATYPFTKKLQGRAHVSAQSARRVQAAKVEFG